MHGMQQQQAGMVACTGRRWNVMLSFQLVALVSAASGSPPLATHRSGIGTVRKSVAAASQGLSLSRSR
jgi:hypothetical protein